MILINKSSWRQFYICCLAYLILFLTVLLSDRLYIDDIGKSIYGTFGWTSVGRPLGDVVAYLVTLGRPLVNIAPLPQLISIVIVSYAALNILRNYQISNPYMAALCTLPLAGQPYYLENMSYCFDATQWALTILLSTKAAFYITTSNTGDKLKGSLCILLTLMLYQPGTSVFFVTCVFIVLRQLDSEYRPFTFVANAITSILVFTLIPFLIYFAITRIITLHPYFLAYNKVLPLSKLPVGLYHHLIEYISILLKDWGRNLVGLAMGVVALGSFVTFIISVINNKSNAVNKVFRIILTLLGLPLIVFASYFPQIILENPICDARRLMGIGAILTLSCLQLYSFCSGSYSGNCAWKKIVMVLPICFLSYALLVFSFSFARANASQKDFESYRLARLGADVEEIISDHKPDSIGFIGSIGKSPLLQNTMHKFPLLERLVPVHIADNWWWGHMQFKTIGISLESVEVTEDERQSITNKLPIMDKSLYSIYVYDRKMIVKFKR